MANLPHYYMSYVTSLLVKNNTNPTSHVDAFEGKCAPPPAPSQTIPSHNYSPLLPLTSRLPHHSCVLPYFSHHCIIF